MPEERPCATLITRAHAMVIFAITALVAPYFKGW